MVEMTNSLVDYYAADPEKNSSSVRKLAQSILQDFGVFLEGLTKEIGDISINKATMFKDLVSAKQIAEDFVNDRKLTSRVNDSDTLNL